MKPVIIVKLQGGLGNQMFQYAVGRHLALLTGTELKLDAISFQDELEQNITLTPRKYGLNCFNIRAAFAAPEEIDWFKKYRRKDGSVWFLYNRLFADETKYAKGRFHFEPKILKLRPPVYLDGWWNTEKYFKDIRPVILKDFTVLNPLSDKNKETAERIRASESVSIHVRRGDYASDPETNRIWGTLGNEYYGRAVKIIRDKVNDPKFFVFSDDVGWVKNNLRLPAETTYVDWNNGWAAGEDLRLMYLCKHHIIANSTFSWWGAWLSENKDKIVIAPARWFRSKKSTTITNDIVPEEWIKI